MMTNQRIISIALEIKSQENITQQWLDKLKEDIEINNDYTLLQEKDVTCLDWEMAAGQHLS